jgi:penicillin-binding protein 1A
MEMSNYRKRKKRQKKQQVRLIKNISIAVALTFGLLIFTGASVIGKTAADLIKKPIGKLPPKAERTILFDAKGRPFASLFAENREAIPLKKIPRHVREAVIAIEDERFYKHHGVDFKGIARAILVNLRYGKVVEGGSTITQQYIKNTFVGKEKTLERKIREVVLAYKLERQYPKNKILESYLNTVYFGHGAYGIEAAAEKFFGKKAQELSLAEGAMLAGLPKSPLRFSPYYYPKTAKKRQERVLRKMVELGYISASEAKVAAAQPLNLQPLKSEEQMIAPYFVEYVKQELINKYGVNKVFKGGLKVYTTLDLKMQKAAERAIKTTLNRSRDPSTAIVALDPKTGFIKALVGGRDFQKQKYNLAVQGRRQPGSAFKTFVLVAALSKGISPTRTYNGGSPRIIPIVGKDERGNWWRGEDWVVRNYGGQSYGSLTVREATIKSVNAVYAQLIMDVGPKNVVKIAKKMGIASPIEPHPAIAIGGLTVGVSPLDMATAYATLASGGIRHKPIAILQVKDKEGNILETNKPKGKRAIPSWVAGETTKILQDVIRRGTGRRANIGRPAAGKTGTTQNYQDAWFIGYTPDLVAAVWVGYPKAQIPMRAVHGRRVSGGTFPALIWHKFMKEALKNIPKHNFNFKYGKIRVVEICQETKLLATPGCPETKILIVEKGEVPKRYCYKHRWLYERRRRMKRRKQLTQETKRLREELQTEDYHRTEETKGKTTTSATQPRNKPPDQTVPKPNPPSTTDSTRTP